MKKPGYLFHKDGRIVFNPELKPIKYNYKTYNVAISYNEALKQWTANCLDVENVCYPIAVDEYRIYLTRTMISQGFKDAQKCLAEIGEKVTIIELLN